MHTHFWRPTVLASVAAAMLTPGGAWSALDLAQTPPGATPVYVAPNVILSLDDSYSMVKKDMIGGTKTRVEVLQEALTDVFSDDTLLPDGKIRLAWQDMWNCTALLTPDHLGNSDWADSPFAVNEGYYDTKAVIDPTRAYFQANLGMYVSSHPTSGPRNAMRKFQGNHRKNFLEYVKEFRACGNTATHKMMRHADEYLRYPDWTYSPWAINPEEPTSPKDNRFLGCRRNYHILFTDGGWNMPDHQGDIGNHDGYSTTLPDGKSYVASSPEVQIYADRDEFQINGRLTNFWVTPYEYEKLYRSGTIADWAFYSWSQNLIDPYYLDGSIQPLPAYMQAPPQETFTNKHTGAKATLEKYWNPKYNPASWPHLVTFTIGFSGDALPKHNYRATDKVKKGNIQPPSSLVPYGYDGNFADYANGTYTWNAGLGGSIGRHTGDDRGHDMWHAAINGRGQFYSVEKGEDLALAFTQIIEQIGIISEMGTGSVTAVSESVGRTDNGAYIASYDPQSSWSGWVVAQTIKPDGKPKPAWNDLSTAHLLDMQDDNWARTGRVVLSASSARPNAGVSFAWGNLSMQEQDSLNLAPGGAADGLGEKRLDFIRGDRSGEGAAGSGLRERSSRQGDIVNSEIWYVGPPDANYGMHDYRDFVAAQKKRPPMIYVGGNDGMLHGFSAEDGTEKLAYVPRGVIPNLVQLTWPGYENRHRYFVDGSPMSGDVYDGRAWKTMLVGALGAGGRGYFVLDVTDPASFSASNAAALAVVDRTLHAREAPAANDAAADIGHIFASPVRDDVDPRRSTQIARLNNGRWAAIMGNGYNSVNERPVLLIQYLDSPYELKTLVATGNVAPGRSVETTENGLSAPRLLDLNADGTPDVVYAGDLKGNMWKFLIASDNDGEWGVAFGGKPLYTAQRNGQAQPITAAPTVQRNTRSRTLAQGGAGAINGNMVAFGTGRNVTRDDRSDTQVQTLYSILDNTRYKLDARGLVQVCASTGEPECHIRDDQVPEAVGSGVARLAQQTVGGSVASTGNRTFFALNETEKVDWNGAKDKGWYMDFPVQGERLLRPMQMYDNSNVMAVFSQVPGTGGAEGEESCNSLNSPTKERQFLTLINIIDGRQPKEQLFDTNGDGVFNQSDRPAGRVTVPPGAQRSFVVSDGNGDRIRFQGNLDDDPLDTNRMPETPLRPSWKQAH